MCRSVRLDKRPVQEYYGCNIEVSIKVDRTVGMNASQRPHILLGLSEVKDIREGRQISCGNNPIK